MISLVLTCIGPDHPGLVEQMAEKITKYHANWEECRMARLAGQFAGILLVTVPDHQADALMRALGGIEGLQVTIQRSEEATVERSDSLQNYRLTVTGHDRPGFVRDVSRTLAARGINLEELETECVEAAMAGTALFKVRALLHIPVELDLDELRFQLESISQEWMVDLQLLKPTQS